jgi:hypothetical protein
MIDQLVADPVLPAQVRTQAQRALREIVAVLEGETGKRRRQPMPPKHAYAANPATTSLPPVGT